MTWEGSSPDLIGQELGREATWEVLARPLGDFSDCLSLGYSVAVPATCCTPVATGLFTEVSLYGFPRWPQCGFPVSLLLSVPCSFWPRDTCQVRFTVRCPFLLGRPRPPYHASSCHALCCPSTGSHARLALPHLILLQEAIHAVPAHRVAAPVFWAANPVAGCIPGHRS